MEALSEGPRVADKLLLTAAHVREFNCWHELHGSHWRVRGELVRSPLTHKNDMLYRLGME